ncbi:MAG: DUF3800 domain-containing protein [Actinomycetota bacterium]
MFPVQGVDSGTLFLFVDESGNFDFTVKGSRHFVMAGIAIQFPIATSIELLSLKYRLISEGEDIVRFHASEDSLITRSKVYKVISNLELTHVHVVYGEKPSLAGSDDLDVKMHTTFARHMVSYATSLLNQGNFRQGIVIFDSCLPKSKQKTLHTELKRDLKAQETPIYLVFQSLKFDMNGQIADYVAWAKFRQLERDDPEYWHLLSKTLRPTEFEVVRDWPRDADS